MAYITDEKGKWFVDGNASILIEPSAEYTAQREAEMQAIEEQKQIEAIAPTQEEAKQAEFEIRTINLLIETGLL